MSDEKASKESATADDEWETMAIRLEGIFAPYSRKRRDKYGRSRFVHYTTAEAALNIIGTKRIWLRNTSCMGDYREVQHGYDNLRIALASGENHKDLSEALDACFPGLASQTFGLFDKYWYDIQANTYIASLSEHDAEEDLHGRLSMWRAFGGGAARVAVVLNIPWYSGGAQELRLMFSPVAYFGAEQVNEEIKTVIKQIRAETEFLRSIGETFLVNNAFNMLIAAVTCMKHEGFHEEREWRAIYGPRRLSSPLMQQSTRVVGGVPQIVYEAPLDVGASPLLSELDIAKLVNRVIIGPTQYPFAIRDAFVETMKQAGIPDPAEKVFISGIPIRA